MPLVLYPLVALILLALLQLYFYLARRLNIVDRPNERSSHQKPTIRGGGIVFADAVILWFLLSGFQQTWAIGGLFVIALVSLFDDLWGTPRSLRLLVHLTAVSLLFVQLNVTGLPWYFLLGVYIPTIGWINAFNFMDGINGITPLYSLVALGTFFYLEQNTGFFDADMILFLAIAAGLFAWFNARKNALTFAGDVGSISMAYMMAWMMIALIMATRQPAWILLFAVYGIDSVMTIIIRIGRRENIFKAHRSHLYQLLANENAWPHLRVAALYALAQLAINLITVWLIFTGKMSIPVLVMMLLLLTLVYLAFRRSSTPRLKG